MATTKQRTAAKRATKKTERHRARAGTSGKGQYYRIDVRPNADFVMYRTQDVGEEGHLQRIAGKRSSGRWDTATWLISKNDAHLDKNKGLVIDHPKVRTALKQISGQILHKKGDVFEARAKSSSYNSLQHSRARKTSTQKSRA